MLYLPTITDAKLCTAKHTAVPPRALLKIVIQKLLCCGASLPIYIVIYYISKYIYIERDIFADFHPVKNMFLDVLLIAKTKVLTFTF